MAEVAVQALFDLLTMSTDGKASRLALEGAGDDDRLKFSALNIEVN